LIFSRSPVHFKDYDNDGKLRKTTAIAKALLREAGAGGSNPLTPTSILGQVPQVASRTA